MLAEILVIMVTPRQQSLFQAQARSAQRVEKHFVQSIITVFVLFTVK